MQVFFFSKQGQLWLFRLFMLASFIAALRQTRSCKVLLFRQFFLGFTYEAPDRLVTLLKLLLLGELALQICLLCLERIE